MKTFLEAIVIVCLLAIVGIAGGLEKGMVSIVGAFVAWGVAAIVAAIAIAVRAKAQ